MRTRRLHKLSIRRSEFLKRKSRVVSEICKRKGSNMRVVCSTGIACEVLKGDKNLSFPPAMLHSFVGVGTA